MSEPTLPPATARPGAPPWTSPDGAPAGLVPLTDLSSPAQITFLGFLAGPFAAVWLMARNFARLRRPRAMWATLAIGAAATAGLFAMAIAADLGSGSRALAMVPVLIVWLIATNLQGPAYAAHAGAGGPATRIRTLVLIAVGALAVQVGALFAVWTVVDPLDGTDVPHVTVAPDQQVHYVDGATRDDATWLGAELTRLGYLSPGHAATVVVGRPGGRVTVGLVVSDEALAGQFDGAFRRLAATLSARGFGGAPVDLELLDGEMKVAHRLPWAAPAPP